MTRPLAQPAIAGDPPAPDLHFPSTRKGAAAARTGRDAGRVERAVSVQGATIGDRYVVGEELGQGSDATVFRGQDLRLGRDVALKFLRPELQADPTFVTRFEREARSVARLDHPHIVPVYEYGEALGTRYLVMQYLPGGDLRARLRDGPLAVERALRIAADIAAALGSAHAQGIVHRDVKPANILLTEDGRAKMTDFGIAKMLDVPALTATAALLGTPHYLAPEQASGGAITPATDVYALGVVLFEMLAGRHLFEGESFVQVAMQHLHADPPRLSDLNPAVPSSLAAVVSRALAKDPAARFADGRAFAAALRAAERALAAPSPVGQPAPPAPPHAVPGGPGSRTPTNVPAAAPVQPRPTEHAPEERRREPADTPADPPPAPLPIRPRAAAAPPASPAAVPSGQPPATPSDCPAAPAETQPAAPAAAVTSGPAPTSGSAAPAPRTPPLPRVRAGYADDRSPSARPRLLGWLLATSPTPARATPAASNGYARAGAPPAVAPRPPRERSPLATPRSDAYVIPAVLALLLALLVAGLVVSGVLPGGRNAQPQAAQPIPPADGLAVAPDTAPDEAPGPAPEAAAPSESAPAPEAAAAAPTEAPAEAPTAAPTPAPTTVPTAAPTVAPTAALAPPANSGGRPAGGAPALGGAGGAAGGQVVIDDDAFTGGFSAPRNYRGRTARWIYGALSPYGQMTATFTVDGTPGAGTLLLKGLDSETGDKTPIAIQVNDTVVFQGGNPLPKDNWSGPVAHWGEATIRLPAGVLRPGRNTLTISNLAQVNNFNAPPYFMLDEAIITYQPAASR